ncbi:valine--tRNA ligase [Methanocella sp. CWC-04]|uniref:Valine--tRNA ligase n=1 Tax=Methanooceanicella nereidis TaxID=2052831 RepID=A0AAP2W448_9EURY|nr:valine--tRNA ligase [Methanocella sp. CWC-04]MCD1293835.1 valine--tRNA ligase [Methanocella sp. CWC-04]
MRELAKKYDPKEIEPGIQKFWEDEKVFKFDPNSEKPTYSIDTPPPTLSGYIHMGHVMSYSQAEFVARYQRMLGKNVFYPMGFDDNGLPTERFVEKKYKVNIKDIGREEFVKLCLKETEIGGANYRNVWTKLGISVDWDLLYSTINKRCQRISQRSFIDLYKQKRMERRNEPAIWCPLCQTSLAQADVEDSDEKRSFLNTIKFKAADTGEDLLIATSRPELISSCVALIVNPEDERYKKLIGRKAITPIFNAEVPVIADRKVEIDFGTGLVMVCTFGDKTDIDWWREYDLPLKLSINADGTMNENAANYRGMTLAECRKQIMEDLKGSGLLVEQKPITHVMNVHERCSTPVEYFVTPQWFIRILDLKDKLLEQGAGINWYPEHMKVRYDTWINGLKWDWCISRQRYFGVPFPVWYCKKCGEVTVAEDSQLPVDPMAASPLHPCPKCGSTEFEPEKDVMDTWATSSVTPLINSNWGEPDSIINKIYPMSLRPQAHEIIRTWLFYTVIKSYLHTGTLPWTTVMISGHGLDSNGKAMHKSKGNIIEPLPVVDRFSADALRWWAASAKLGDDLSFKDKEVVYGQKFINKLWNASRFVSMHLKDYKPGDDLPELELIDRWLLTKLNNVIRESTDNFNRYEYSKAKVITEQFFWGDLCDNYLEMVKDRLYKEGSDSSGSREAVLYTLYTTLLSCLKLLGPFTPHVTEEIYQCMFRDSHGALSLHISSWPTPNESWEDADALRLGNMAGVLVSTLRQYKNSNNLAQNSVLKSLKIYSDGLEEDIKLIEPVLKDTMKIGEISYGPVEEADAVSTLGDVQVLMKIER